MSVPEGQRPRLGADDLAALPAALLEELAQRARHWPAVLEETVPPRLALDLPHARALALALPLLFTHAEPIDGAANLLRLDGPRIAPVELDPAAGAWRCTVTGAAGRGALELVAWVRGKCLLEAAAWFYGVARPPAPRGALLRWPVAA